MNIDAIWKRDVLGALTPDLDPHRLHALIVATHDRLPCAASLNESGVRAPKMERCQDATCDGGGWWDDERACWEHSHATPTDPVGDAAMRPSESDADLALLVSSVSRFVEAVGKLAAASRSGRLPMQWHEAVKDAELLGQMDAVADLERIDHGYCRRWVVRAGDALHDIRAIHGRHAPREATEFERHKNGTLPDGCTQHERIGSYAARHGKQPVCKTCYDLKRASDGHLPTLDMLRALGDGRIREYGLLRQEWLQRHGVKVAG